MRGRAPWRGIGIDPPFSLAVWVCRIWKRNAFWELVDVLNTSIGPASSEHDQRTKDQQDLNIASKADKDKSALRRLPGFLGTERPAVADIRILSHVFKHMPWSPTVDCHLRYRNFALTSHQVILILHELKDNIRHSLNFFMWAGQQRGHCCTAECLEILKGTMHAHVDHLHPVVKELESDGRFVPLHVIMLAMEVFIEKHMVETAVEMFQSILKLHTRPDEDAYHLILQVLLESGRTDVAMEIYEQMKKDRWCNPVSSTFLLMLWGLGKTAKIGEAQKLLEDLKSKNEISISEAHCQLVRGLCEGPWMDYAVQAIIEMYELGFEPDENVHISFVHGYIRAGRLMEAFNYYKDAVSSNLIAPKMDVLTLLLSSFCAQKNPEIAQEVLMAMVETGLCPDPHIYVSVIQCVLEQGQGQLNPWLSGALRKQGVDKDVKFFSSIIILCTDAGDVEAALSVFCQMVTYHSICPEKAAFSALVFKMFEYNQANFWQKLFSAIEGSEMSLQTTIFQMVSDILANVDEKVANHVLSLMKDTCLSKLTIRPK